MVPIWFWSAFLDSFGRPPVFGSIGIDAGWVGLASNSPPPQVRFFFILSGAGFAFAL